MNSSPSAPKQALQPEGPPKVPFLTNVFGSGLFAGYAPFASGTVGSAVGLAIYWIPGFERTEIIASVSAAVLFLGIIASSRMERAFGHDPSQVTIDEVLGMWISLLLLPKGILVSAVAFVVFRALDVVKPPPARAFDRLRGGAGIMLDDVVAGLYTNLVMRVLLAIGIL